MNGRPRYLILLAIGIGGAMLALVLSFGLARHRDARAASVLMVDTLEDELNTDGDCSLREAIAAANGNIASDACPAGDAVISDTIHFSVSGTIVLTSQLHIAAGAPVVIQAGQNITLSGGTTVGVLEVNSGADLTLQGLAIIDGNADIGGGINNLGRLSMSAISLSGNWAQSEGGGLYNSGEVTITNSTISGNTVSDQELRSDGGGIYNTGTIRITNSSLIANNAKAGGGVYNNGGSVFLTNSTVSGNSSSIFGGGVVNETANLWRFNATITNNSAGNSGGGVHSDLAWHTQNSIIAGNTAGASGPDCYLYDVAYSDGYNLIGDSSDCGITSSPGDLINVNPFLAPLKDNGGPTQTHALLIGSPAIDGGDPNGCTDRLVNLLKKDQRGVARLNRCDIGAYEYPGSSGDFEFVHLPLMFEELCLDNFDNFSDPNSGWWVGDEPEVLAEYLNGEYRVLIRPADTLYLFGSPACASMNYTVEVDARWAGVPNAGYGLVFGILGDFDQFYLFQAYPDNYGYIIYRYDPSGWVPIYNTYGGGGSAAGQCHQSS